jgi:hypothetical protein
VEPAPAADAPVADAGAPDDSASALVATLWRTAPPEMWALERRLPAVADGVHVALARVARDAEHVAAGAAAEPERAAARLLAETAWAILAALGDRVGALVAGAVAGPVPGPVSGPVSGPVPGPAATAGAGLASPVRLRLARMERWLAARAAGDPAAGPAADLCLWVVEQLEVEAPRPG